MERKYRILIGKVGLDGHDVGARLVAKALADSGIEVIYTGLRQTPEQIVMAALQEGVDAIGISILSGSHMSLLADIHRLLSHQASDIPLVAGGIIPAEDFRELKEMGVRQIFPPETPLDEIVNYMEKIVSKS